MHTDKDLKITYDQYKTDSRVVGGQHGIYTVFITLECLGFSKKSIYPIFNLLQPAKKSIIKYKTHSGVGRYVVVK